MIDQHDVDRALPQDHPVERQPAARTDGEAYLLERNVRLEQQAAVRGSGGEAEVATLKVEPDMVDPGIDRRDPLDRHTVRLTDPAPVGVEEAMPQIVDVIIAQRGKPGLRFLDRQGRTAPW